ncbi:MAG: hypothetical protein ACRDYF_12115, partial [Acidimicrobiia bacterium]
PETPTVIRGACILLMIVGLVSVLFSLPVALGPAKAQCQLSRTWLDDANTDKKDWNNVDTGGQNAKDLPCPDAIRLAEQVPLNEKGTKKVTVPSESALQIQNAVAVAMGVGQAASGFYVVRTMSRRSRIAAIGFSVAGTVIQILGILSLGVFVFVVYAFVFSPASREIWPREVRG